MRFAIAIDVFNNIVDGRDGTLRLDGQSAPQGGYFVGGNRKPLVFSSAEEANTPDAMHRINQFTEALSSDYVGWWTDSADGKVYVDGTDWFATTEEASKASFDRHEIAFWGVAEEAEFRFGYTRQS